MLKKALPHSGAKRERTLQPAAEEVCHTAGKKERHAATAQ